MGGRIRRNTQNLKHAALAGPMGTGLAIIGPDLVEFNGDAACGHARRDFGIVWPATGAKGVDPKAQSTGNWHGGALIPSRTCDGDCSNESFVFLRTEDPDDHLHRGLCSRFCKTAYKPYDLAVQVFLVIAKQHLGDSLLVLSDGELANWLEAQGICQQHLGYGDDFVLSNDDDLSPPSD